MRVLDVGRRADDLELGFSPDGGRLVVGVLGCGIAIHHLAGGTPVPLDPRGSFFAGIHGAFSVDGRTVHAVTYDGRVGFDPETGRPVTTGPADPAVPGRCHAASESADGSRLVVVQTDPPGTWLVGWAAAAGGWERRWAVRQGGGSAVTSLTPAGDRVAQIGCLTPGGWDYHLLLRDGATGELVATGGYDYTMLSRPHLRPDGRQVVAARDAVLLVWDTRVPGKPVVVRNDSRRHFTAAAYHPSGRYLFTTSYDATVTVWDTDTWARVKRFDWAVGRLRAVAVSPDGLLAAAGSDRGRVVVWDVDL